MHTPETGDASPAIDVPEGFTRLRRGGPYFSLLGPVYSRSAGENRIVIGLRLDERHLNARGVAHGGMLMTLADSALGVAIILASGARGLATVHLSSDFLEPGRPGDWLEAHVEIDRLGRRTAFATCHLEVAGQRILRASGVFSILRSKE